MSSFCPPPKLSAKTLKKLINFFFISGCAAFWCPCIIYARNKKRIENLYAEEKVHPNRGGTCSDDCAIHACMSTFCLFGWAIQVSDFVIWIFRETERGFFFLTQNSFLPRSQTALRFAEDMISRATISGIVLQRFFVHLVSCHRRAGKLIWRRGPLEMCGGRD